MTASNDEVWRLAHWLKDLTGGSSPVHPEPRPECPICHGHEDDADD